MSSKRQENVSKKLAVLQVIEQEKEVLFAPFSSTVTHDMKVAGWEKVLITAKSIGLVAQERDWKFLRDKVFSVWKSRTLGKRDNARKTGSAGGKDKIFDEVDNKILDIVDRESPIVDGLGLPESDGGGQVNHSETTLTSNASVPSTSSAGEPSIQLQASGGPGRISKRNRLRNALQTSREEKEKLVIELLKTEVHLRKLQCLKLEKELGLKPSKLTEALLLENQEDESQAPSDESSMASFAQADQNSGSDSLFFSEFHSDGSSLMYQNL